MTLPFVVGTNHALAPAATRERLGSDPQRAIEFLEGFAERARIREYVVLSTCARFELYGAAPQPERAQRMLRAAAARTAGLPIGEVLAASHALVGGRAVIHLHRVAAGLESAVQGEAQILGQVRRALVQHGRATAGPVLHRLFQSAVETGKRVRSETGLGRGAVSLAGAALDLVRRRAGGLAEMRVLVIGAGETGSLVARVLRDAGVAELLIANRTRSRAEALADKLNGRVLDLETIQRHLPAVDLVVVAVNARSHLVTVANLSPNGHPAPRWFLDLSHPAAIDRDAVARVPSAELIDLDSIHERVLAARAERDRQVPAAEAIVARGVDEYLDWLSSRATLPVVRKLREDVLQRARREADRHARGLAEEERRRFEEFARALARSLLHQPTRALRDVDPHTEEGRAVLRSAGLLFGIDAADPPSNGGPHRRRGTSSTPES